MKFKDTLIYKYGVQGVLENKDIEREYGGDSCYNEMTLFFKITVNLILIAISSFTIARFHKKVVPKVNLPKKRGPKATAFEFFLGTISVSIFLVQLYYKINTQSVFFIFNPCHICTVR